MPAYAAQVIIAIIPIVGIVMGSTVLFFYLLCSHRERMILIEQGNFKPSRFDLHLFSLFSGFLLTGVGAALTAVFLILDGFSYASVGGLLPLSLGLSLLVFSSLNKRNSGGE